MTVLPEYISLLRWLWELLLKLSRLKLCRNSGFSNKIGTISPNSGSLDTLQGFFGGSGGMLPRKKLDIWGLQTAGNALKLPILPSPCYFCIILNILRSHQADLFGSWGVCAHPAHPPAYGPDEPLAFRERIFAKNACYVLNDTWYRRPERHWQTEPVTSRICSWSGGWGGWGRGEGDVRACLLIKLARSSYFRSAKMDKATLVYEFLIESVVIISITDHSAHASASVYTLRSIGTLYSPPTPPGWKCSKKPRLDRVRFWDATLPVQI